MSGPFFATGAYATTHSVTAIAQSRAATRVRMTVVRPERRATSFTFYPIPKPSTDRSPSCSPQVSSAWPFGGQVASRQGLRDAAAPTLGASQWPLPRRSGVGARRPIRPVHALSAFARAFAGSSAPRHRAKRASHAPWLQFQRSSWLGSEPECGSPESISCGSDEVQGLRTARRR